VSQSFAARETLLPFSRPHIGEDEINEVTAVMRSGWLTTGPRVEQFETDLSAFWGGAEVVSLNSGTAALHLAVLAAGLGPGDEVITTPMTWPATANMVLLAGARPVFVDIDRHTLNLDPALVEAAVTPRTRALLPVHFAGLSCDMAALGDVARRHGLTILEDAAHSLGATCADGPSGLSGLAGCFSFHPTKPITTGEGGALVTRDPAVAAKARLLRFHGVTRGAAARMSGTADYEVAEVGFKYNMLDMQAAIGIHQLRQAEVFRARREVLARLYHGLLADLNGELLHLPTPAPASLKHAWHIYVVKIATERLTCDRNGFRTALRALNVATGLHYLTLNIQPVYQRDLGCSAGDCPESVWASERVVSLPLYSDMTEDDVAYAAAAVREVLTSHAR
jgi:dTDP-4-amino-4,6-dideoxygalactose transaminase